MFLDGENNSTFRHLLEKDWDILLRDSALSEVNLNHLLDKIHHQIRRNENQKKKTILRRFTRIYMKVAAILLLPLLIAGGLVYNYKIYHGKPTINRQTGVMIYAPMGARISFDLPDGTTGMLNSGSKLSYYLPFTDSRRVKLEGEAWLEVNHYKDRPFEVSTGNSIVKVLGTSFNVSAYPEENYVEVVLQDGEVEFLEKTGSDKVTMLPSERLVFRNGNISKSVTDPSKYNAWTEGKLVFRGDQMAEVARRLERWYNVKVDLADRQLEKYSFRAIFLDDTLEDVLRFLSMTSPIRYSIAPSELMQDGTYKKEVVTIYLKK